MGNDPANQPSREETAFARQVAAKAARKLRAQRDGSQGVWFGLGMSGLIGWSVEPRFDGVRDFNLSLYL